MKREEGILPMKSSKKSITGVLVRCEKNPRYFADSNGKPVYLTGSHTWSNLQEYLGPDPDKKFDFAAYLDWMESYGSNFMRLWVWEEASYDNFSSHKLHIDPLPYARTGPGTALDGGLRFDLNTFNQEYFDRLRGRVIEAGKRGIYVSIMLFNRWSINLNRVEGAVPWKGHPYNKENNINGIDGDPSSIGGRTIHTLLVPEVVRCQEGYIKKVIDTVNDLENVLYEIGNEHYEESWQWQYHMVRFIKMYEADKPLQHPVGITSGGGEEDAITNSQLFESPADWISPRDENGMPYREEPVAADGSKVIISDTDHLWGFGGSADWVWKSFTRGMNPILMDPYEPIYGLENYGTDTWTSLNRRDHPIWEPIRINMAYAKKYAQRMNLEAAIPREDIASSGYCLADKGQEYLVYIPDGREVTVKLGGKKGRFLVEWMNPANGECLTDTLNIDTTGQVFTNPFSNAAVLYIKSV